MCLPASPAGSTPWREPLICWRQVNRVLLVSHYDFGQLAGAQNLLTDRLISHYGQEKVRRWGFRIQFEAPELSLRSRSLLFIGLGVAAAAVWGQDLPLHIPENGWISLNPPLTSNRLGSYSTRTTHPYFISGLKNFLASVGINQDLVNPFQFETKGEMLRRSRNRSSAARIAALYHFLRPSGGLPVEKGPPGKLRLLFPLPDAPGRLPCSGMGRRPGISL